MLSKDKTVQFEGEDIRNQKEKYWTKNSKQRGNNLEP